MCTNINIRIHIRMYIYTYIHIHIYVYIFIYCMHVCIPIPLLGHNIARVLFNMLCVFFFVFFFSLTSGIAGTVSAIAVACAYRHTIACVLFNIVFFFHFCVLFNIVFVFFLTSGTAGAVGAIAGVEQATLRTEGVSCTREHSLQ